MKRKKKLTEEEKVKRIFDKLEKAEENRKKLIDRLRSSIENFAKRN